MPSFEGATQRIILQSVTATLARVAPARRQGALPMALAAGKSDADLAAAAPAAAPLPPPPHVRRMGVLLRLDAYGAPRDSTPLLLAVPPASRVASPSPASSLRSPRPATSSCHFVLPLPPGAALRAIHLELAARSERARAAPVLQV